MEHKSLRGLPLFWRLTMVISGLWFLLLVVTMAVTMRYSLITFQNKIDDILMSTVTTLAEAPAVRRNVEAGRCDREFSTYLDSVVANTTDLEYITIADADSVRIYHVDPAFIGLPFEGDDENRALAGEVYLSDAETKNFPSQRRAFHPVRAENGQVIGFVMASASYERIHALRWEIIEAYLKIGAMVGFFTLIFCGLLAMYLGRNLRGIRSDDVIRMYLTQNAILNSMEEGLLSFDNNGHIRLVNAAAARMLGKREELLLGRHVDDVLLDEHGKSLIDREGQGFQSNHPNVLVLPVQLPDRNLWARQVMILADKSELRRYAEDLGGTRHMVNTLRANNHEFINKLQVISGMLQIGRVAEAQEYIGNLAQAHEHILGPVMRLIHNPSVAALILGKEAHMQERDIDMILLSNSTLPERSSYLTTTELVTILGNLMENAIEATDAIGMDDLRCVAVQVTEDEKGLLLMVTDTGEGIAPENLSRIYDTGFSTKASSGRGLGMKRIKEIVDRRGGTIDVESEPGSGTTFTIIFSRERGAQP